MPHIYFAPIEKAQRRRAVAVGVQALACVMQPEGCTPTPNLSLYEANSETDDLVGRWQTKRLLGLEEL